MGLGPDVDAGDDSATDTVRVGSPVFDPLPQPAPAVLGRYLVLEEVGCGGMGRVYRAYDPKLDRVVALKCLRLGDASETGASAGRIVREARLMARLSHPNVVPVYDVERADDILFVAMEFVTGETIGDWLTHQPSVHEILGAFEQAGRGLAAAHEAGIVHRDLKPSNVMIGRDGRARVMDFGISRANDERPSSDHSYEGVSPLAEADDVRTEIGHVVGTPVYMAPEQHAGRPTDARSDQYSFCLVLFEALYGCRAFSVRDHPTLLEEKLASVPKPPARRGVPRRVARAVARGLAPDPAARWASMHELVQRIRPPLQPRPVQMLALAAALGLVAIIGYFAGRREPDDCDAEAVRRDWSAVRTDVREAVAASVGDSTARVVAGLDDFVDELASVMERRCDAATLGSNASGHDDASARCIEGAHRAFDAVQDLLLRRGAEIGPRALDAVLALPDPRVCVDRERLRTVPPVPDDPEAAIEVRRLRAALADAKALEDVGDYVAALALARAQAEDVSAATYPPLTAELLLREGTLLSKSGDYVEAVDALQRGHLEAVAGGHEGAALATATALIEVVGGRQARFADAEVWIQHARAWIERVGEGGGEEARLLSVIALLDSERGRYDDARGGLERALVLLDAIGRSEHTEAAALHDALGGVLHRQADLDAAALHHTHALVIRESALGPDHPDVATALESLGILAEERGRLPEAIDLHMRALAIREAALGPEHPDVAAVLVNLGVALEHAGDFAAARSRLERAAAITESALGPDHPRLGATTGNLGNVDYAMGNFTEALVQYERALGIFRRALGPEHPDVAMAHHNVGLVAMQLGRYDRAREELESALDVWRRTLGPVHPSVAMALANLGENSHAAGRHADAARQLTSARAILLAVDPVDEVERFRVTAMLGIVHAALGEAELAMSELEQAIALGQAVQADDQDLSGVRFELGKLMWRSEAQRRQAHALVEASRSGFAMGGGDPAQLAAAERWLLKHTAPEVGPSRPP